MHIMSQLNYQQLDDLIKPLHGKVMAEFTQKISNLFQLLLQKQCMLNERTFITCDG